MGKRNFLAINLMKLGCVLLVISMYVGMFSSLNNVMNFVINHLLAKIAFPFFFISSSFFFFRKIDFTIPLSDKININKLKVYLFKLIRLYVIWTIMYLPLMILNLFDEGFTAMHLFIWIRNFFFVGSYPHLWIFPALLSALMIVYYLLLKIKPNEILLIAFICYLIGMLINVYGSFLSEIAIIEDIINLYLNIFSTSVNGLFYAFIFVCLGMKLSMQQRSVNKSHIMIKLFIMLGLYLIEISLLTWLGYTSRNTQMYISLLPLMYFLFLLLMQYRSKDDSMIDPFATLLYLVQFYAIELCQQFTFLNEYYFICLLMIVLLSSCISFMILKRAKRNRKIKVLYTC